MGRVHVDEIFLRREIHVHGRKQTLNVFLEDLQKLCFFKPRRTQSVYAQVNTERESVAH
jgi:hypothetical protein